MVSRAGSRRAARISSRIVARGSVMASGAVNRAPPIRLPPIRSRVWVPTPRGVDRPEVSRRREGYCWCRQLRCRVLPSWSGILVGRGSEVGVDRRVSAPSRAGSGATAAAHSACRWARALVRVGFPPHPRSWVRAQASARASECASCGSQRGISETSRHSSTTPASRHPAADHRDPGPVHRPAHPQRGPRWLRHTGADPRLGWSHDRCFSVSRITRRRAGGDRSSIPGRSGDHSRLPARAHRAGLPAAGP
jgi:hypothetical protein